MPGKVMDRYFIFETLRTFLLVLVCFFALFVLIDYTSRSSSLHLNGAEIAVYYSHLFVRRVEILAPFALLVAVVRIVCQANSRYELAAMMACGISLRRLLRPIAAIGLGLTLLLFLNSEFLVPDSMLSLRRVEDAYAQKSHQKKKNTAVNSLVLSDGSRLIYKSYDSSQEQFLDLYWFRSLDDIYRMKALLIRRLPPLGYFVERFERNDRGQLLLKDTASEQELKQMSFDEPALNEALTPPSDRSLRALWQKLPSEAKPLSNEEAQVQGAFYRKLVMPWLAFLACIGAVPFCARFRRPVPAFMLYCACLTGILMIYLWISAASILAQSQVLAPIWGLALPMSALVIYAGILWTRMR